MRWTRLPPPVFVLEDAHDPIVVPRTGDPCGLPFRSFMDETACAVAADSPLVVGEDSQVHAVQLQFIEGVIKHEADRRPSNSTAEVTRVQQAKRKARAAVRFVDIVETTLADEAPVRLYHPGAWMVDKVPVPGFGAITRHLWQMLGVASVHADDLG